MCDAVTTLNGEAIDSIRQLRTLDGDESLIPSTADDRECLCCVDLPVFLLTSPRHFKQARCIVASIFSAWSEADSEGRTFSDAFDMIEEDDITVRLVRRDDWPHGFEGLERQVAP